MPNKLGHIVPASLAQMFDGLQMGMLVEDADRYIIYCNRLFLDMFGIQGDSTMLEGLYCPDTAHEGKYFFKDPDKFLKDIHNIPERQQVHEEVVETRDGRFLTRRYIPSVVDGKVANHLWTYIEITETIKGRRELEAQKDFYSTILNEIPADIAIFSPEHKYIFVNKKGIKNDAVREWIIGKDDYEFCSHRGYPASIADERRKLFTEAVTTGQVVSWIDNIDSPEGERIYTLRNFYPYYVNGELQLVIGYGININKQKEYEAYLEKQNEQVETLLDSLNDGVFQLTKTRHVTFYNDSFLRLMNIERSLIKEEYNKDIIQNVHPDDIPLLYTAYNTLKDTGIQQSGDFRIVDSAGEVLMYVNFHIWLIMHPDYGKCVTGRLSDMTQRTKHEIQMQAVIEREKEANSMKSNFIHITSHELRTPLSYILSSAEIIKYYNTAEDISDTADTFEEYTNGIIKEVNRITDILDEMMMMGRMEKGNVRFNPEWIPLKEYIDQICTDLYSPYTDGRTLSVQIDPGIQYIYIDGKLMRYAITNLINNAFKYSQHKQAPELKIYSTGDNICIEVTDYGIGIPKADVEKLFNSFFRASNVGNISGTGIGLMIVDFVVKLHRGNVNINSRQGMGTIFTICTSRA